MTQAFDTRDMAEPRLITEQGVAARVAAIATPVLAGMGYRLVRVRISGTLGCTVQIMAERPDGSMVDRGLRGRLACALAGLRRGRPDRPRVPAGSLVAGHRSAVGEALGLRAPCRPRSEDRNGDCQQDGRKRFRGILTGVEGEAAKLRRKDAAEGEPADVLLPIADMAEARLVLTDELVRESLRQGKSRRARRSATQTTTIACRVTPRTRAETKGD